VCKLITLESLERKNNASKILGNDFETSQPPHCKACPCNFSVLQHHPRADRDPVIDNGSFQTLALAVGKANHLAGMNGERKFDINPRSKHPKSPRLPALKKDKSSPSSFALIFKLVLMSGIGSDCYQRRGGYRRYLNAHYSFHSYRIGK